MQLYNSLTRKKENFVPVQPGKVNMYACGITAYDYCHIGHARSAVVFDVLVRYLRSLGFEVKFARNFTDVDDKIINKANQEGIPSTEIAEKYIKAFHEDMDKLAVLRADIEPKATEYIQEMIDLSLDLIDKGHAYSTPSGDVYFRVRSFPSYGKLSGRNLDDMQAGARIAPGEEKEDPMDFALWKAAKPGEPFWESPWGKGRPGWHIECSAMSEKNMPLPMDIHGGGQDLIFPHHENEIAQSEAALGKPLANYWVHNGFVQIDSEKMSKSLGNFKTIRDILESYQPETLRFFLLTRQYRSPVDFSFMAMDEAEKNLHKIYQTLAAVQEALSKDKWAEAKDDTALNEEIASLADSWAESMADDMNTAAALGHTNNLSRLAGRILEDKALRKNSVGRNALRKILELFSSWGKILGLFEQEPSSLLNAMRAIRVKRKGINVQKVEGLLAERLEARKDKDFAKSDAIRTQLISMGVELKDTPEGTVWDLL